MKKICIFTLLFCFATSASAAIIDFRSVPYASTFFPPNPEVTTDTVNGVNFTITATARGVDGFRQNSDGLRFGVPGNGMYSISIVSDADLEYTSLLGKGHTLTNFAGQLPFDISVNGVQKIDNLQFPASTFNAENLSNIAVSAGDAFLIAVDFTALTGSRVFASAVLQTLSFNKVQSPPLSTVPLPATILLFIGGLGILRAFTGKT